MFAPDQDRDEHPKDAANQEETEPQVGEPDDFTGSTETILESSAIAPLTPQDMEGHSKDEGNPTESTTIEDGGLEKKEQGNKVTHKVPGSQAEELEASLEDSKKKINDLQMENYLLLRQNQEEISGLKSDIEHLEYQKGELCNKIESLRDDMNQLEEEKDKEIRELLKTSSKLTSAYDLVTMELEEAKGARKRAEENEKAKEKELQDLKEPLNHKHTASKK